MKITACLLIVAAFTVNLSECGRERIHYWRRTTVANRYFSHTLYQRLARTTPIGRNIIVSPYAVSAGLSMVLYGSDGNTADELVRTLEYTDIDDARDHSTDDSQKHIRVARLYQKMKEQLIDTDHGGFVLNAPNRLFLDNTEEVQADYIDGMERFFGAESAKVDFLHNPAQAVDEINDFVSDATNGTITEAVSPDTVSSGTRLVLISTLHFSADWEHPFDSKLTRMGDFKLLDGSTVETEFMNSGLEIYYSEAYGDCEGCLRARYIELPYKSNSTKYKMVMELILPNDHGEDGLRNLEAELDEGTLIHSTSGKYIDMMHVKLPKFTLEYSRNLMGDLKHMGINDIFDPEQADLSLINGKRNLFFSGAQHKTYLKVDEKGTTASASFSLAATRSGNQISFDRPFLLIIREQYTKMPLFMARIADPTA